MALGAFAMELEMDTLEHARTLAFSTLVYAQIFNALAFRSFTRVSYEVGLFSNPRLLLVMGVTGLLQVGLVALPWTNELFELGPFSWTVMGLSVLLGLVPPTLLELWKLLRRRLGRPAAA